MSRASPLQSFFEKRGLPYPIDWSKISNPRLVYRAILESKNSLKLALYLITIGLLLSTTAAAVSAYFLFTTQVEASGGVLREATVGGQMNLFNPVLDRSDALTRRENNQPERKINSLLYAPLYEVEQNNGLTSTFESTTIRPILLKEAPRWEISDGSENAYKKLNLVLRADAKWSDNSALTCDDVSYTLDRLKEQRGNPRYRSLVQDVTLSITSPTNCAFEFTVSSPQALYQLDIPPISRAFFENQNNDGLFVSLKSAHPKVTSGQWILPEQIQDIDSTKQKNIQNPVQKNGENNIVILTPSSVNNYAAVGRKMPSVTRYALYKYDALTAQKLDSKTRTLAQAATDKDVDLFTRTYDQGLLITPTDVRTALPSLNQKIIPQNTYLQLFFNIRKGEDGYLINQSLRRYIACNIYKFSSPTANRFFVPVPQDRKLLPPELETSAMLECPTNPATLLDKVYVLDSDTTGKSLRIGTAAPFSLKMIASREYLPILEDLKTYFKSQIGIDLVITADETEVQNSLASRDYHFALLSNRIVSRDISSAYSAKKRNLVSLPSNDRIAQYNINQNLDLYTHSNGADATAKTQLIDFFKNEAVVMTLYQSQQEINYSNRIFNINTTLPEFTINQVEFYRTLPQWYIQTKRVFKKW